jgi:hypothetical protein
MWEYNLVSCKQNGGNNNRKCPENGYTAYQGDTHLSYGNRLHLALPALQYRRIRADVVETFKIIKGMDKVEIDTIFPKYNTATTRGHKY